MAQLTNEEKFKTPEERIKAFKERCEARSCDKCELEKYGGDCEFYWLALEAKAEKPEPCFYCGGEVKVVDAYKGNEPRLACGNCAYVSCAKPTKEEVIAEHNRVARAVRAAKESDVKG